MKFIEKFANSKFMTGLAAVSQKMLAMPAFAALSSSMGATMGLIMIGAVIQVICALLDVVFGIKAGNPIYDTIYLPYNLTMGMLGFFMVFTLAHTYSKILKTGNPIQNGFVAMVCYLAVVAPPVSAMVGESAITALNLGNMSGNSMFVAMLIGLLSVRISKFAVDHNWVIKMPDVIPEGVLAGFNAIIPGGINIIVWYGLSWVLSTVSGGALTLSTLIIYIISIPMNYLLTPVGMLVVIMIAQLSWFIGIHGNSIIFAVIMMPYFAAHTTNAQLAAQGLPLVFSAVFLHYALGQAGGMGNTLSLTIMGMRSKSKQIKSVAKAAFVPGLFGINEPVIFGMPIMYNPVLLIPFILSPVVTALLMWAGWATGILALPQVLIFSTMPMVVGEYLRTFGIANALFPILVLFTSGLIYFPFFKIYERQCLEQEAAEEAEVQ